MKAADILTLGNFSLGLLSILFSIKGSFAIAAFLMLGAVVMDVLDGRLARLMKQSDEFGMHLDSLADLTSFGVAVAVFGFMQGFSCIYCIIILLFFASCGVYRLARFNTEKKKSFSGVPITVNGVLFPVLYFAGFRYLLPVYIIMGLLMVSKIQIKKW